MPFWVLKTHPEVCDGNQHGDPGLLSISLHLVLKNILNFGHRPSEIPCNFV